MIGTFLDRGKRTESRGHTPQFNYEPFNSNSVNIRSWSWNYRGCWHQTCPPIVTRCWMVLNIPHWKSQTHEAFGTPISFRCLIICFGIGQFARLLPSVEVVAISQAPSPESNPNPPLPSTPWQSTTRPSLADRAVVRQKTLARPAFAKMNWFSTTPWYCIVRCIGLYFHSSAGSVTTLSASLRRVERNDPISSCISLAFRTRYPIMRFRNIFAADCVWCNEPCADSCIAVILRHAWLSPWNKHMTTGRINQISIVFKIFIK